MVRGIEFQSCGKALVSLVERYTRPKNFEARFGVSIGGETGDLPFVSVWNESQELCNR
jgi:hypothetical protein